jgi:hypothetical protein
MSSLIDFQKEAKKALELENVRQFVDQHGSDPTFWEWVNSSRIPVPLFFAIAKHLNQSETETDLGPRRQHLLWQYRTALGCDKEERRSPVLTKMQEIGLQVAYNPPTDGLIEATARDVLDNSKLTEFAFESQQAVYLYNFLAAAAYPTLSDAVVNTISSDAQLFRDQAILSAVVIAFGPPIVELIAKASLETSTQAEDLAQALELITGQPREDKPPQEYAGQIMVWYDQVKSKLTIDHDATYPAPPFKPLLVGLPQCPQCGTVNELINLTCSKCGAELKVAGQPNSSPSSVGSHSG